MRPFAGLLSALAVCALVGCGIPGLPSQQHPDCSWNSVVPSNADQLCSVAFRTTSALVRAQVRGDDPAIRRLVSNPRVAANIIAYGRLRRSQRINFLHVVPSMTLDAGNPHLLGAGFFVVGKTAAGRVDDPETLYMVVHGSSAQVTQDQPNEAW